jgi:hypothetical protein
MAITTGVDKRDMKGITLQVAGIEFDSGADLSIGDDLAVTDDLTVGGDAAITGTLAVTSTSVLTGATTVTGTLTTGGTIELGHASANTLSGSSGVLSIEGHAVATVDQAQTISGQYTMTSPIFVTPTLGAASGTSLTLSGALVCNGNVDLGNAAADTVTITGNVIIPLASVPSYADQTAAAAALSAGQLFRFDTTGALGIALT